MVDHDLQGRLEMSVLIHVSRLPVIDVYPRLVPRRLRRRGQLPGSKSIPIHDPPLMYASRLVRSFTFLILQYPDPDHSWAIPVCMFFQWVWQRPRYHWTQILGVFIAMVGLALQVVSDHLTSKDWVATNMVRGDIFMLVGATLYGFSECPLPLYGVMLIVGGCSERDGGEVREGTSALRGRWSTGTLWDFDQWDTSGWVGA